jgi:dolichol-phosphate mannosyltransferase
VDQIKTSEQIEQEDMPSISVIIPCYYSSETITTLTAAIIDSCNSITSKLEIILVDDGSKDKTWQVISNLSNGDSRIRGLRFSKNFGQHKAIMAGLRESRFDLIVVMDADMQDNPTEIPKLVSKAKSSGTEVTLAKRIRKRHSILKRFGSKIFSRMFTYMSGLPSDSAFGNFGVYSRKAINEVKSFGDRDFLLGNLVTWSGFSSSYIEIDHNERQSGKSTYSLKALLSLAYSVLISNSNLPLRLIVFIGSVVSTLSLAFAAVIVMNYFLTDETPLGWTSMIVTTLLSTGVLLISMGVVGLYIGRIFDSTKQRPLYIISDRT